MPSLEITLIITATGGLIIHGLAKLALRAARVQELVHQELWGDVVNLPNEIRRARNSGGEVGPNKADAPVQVMSLTHDGSGQ